MIEALTIALLWSDAATAAAVATRAEAQLPAWSVQRFAAAADLWPIYGDWPPHDDSWLAWTQEHWAELLECPPACALAMFPGRAYCDAAARDASEHQRGLEAWSHVAPAWMVEYHLPTIQRQRQAAWAWWYLSVAHQSTTSNDRRRKLNELLRVIGPERFYGGMMPPPIN